MAQKSVDQLNNSYLDSDVLITSQSFTPANNAAFVDKHSINIKDAHVETSKESGFLLVSDKPNGPNLSNVLNGPNGPNLSMDEEDKCEVEATQNHHSLHQEKRSKYYEYPLYSVESGFHSLLTALNLPMSCEVLVTSLISPSMMRVIALHGLIPKPMDIDLETMTPTTNIEQLLTNNTKLIIFNHLFGCTIPIRNRNGILDDILVIEDCTSCPLYGSSSLCTDVKMCALDCGTNGAMFTFKDESLMQKVEKITNTYSKQSVFVYLSTCIFHCIVLKPLGNKYILRIFIMMCHLLCIDDVDWYNGTIASYSYRHTRQSTKQFMSLLELQPCSYLRNKIQHQYKKKKNTTKTQQTQKKRSAVLSSLTAITDTLIVGKSCDAVYHDTVPIVIKDRDRNRVLSDMRYLGYNVSNGNTRLMVVRGSCNGNYFLSNAVYLPFRGMDLHSFDQMLSDFSRIMKRKSGRDGDESKRGLLSSDSLPFILKLCAVLFVLRYIWFYLCIGLLIAYYFLRPTKKFRDSPYRGTKQARVCSKTKITAVITGATGFLGEVLVKDLLDTYPSHLIQLYLIIRGKKELSAHERATQLFGQQVMNKTNIVVMDAELDALNIHEIQLEEPITHVIHSAGNVKFSDRHSSIANVNISCSLKMKQLADTYNATFVYISTAFVHGGDSSKATNYLNASPKPLPGHDLSARQLYHLMLGDAPEVGAYMKRNHIENNYILSKMIAENLIGSTSIVIRPSIITPAWNFPEPGWGGRTPSTVTVVAAGMASRLMRCIAYINLRGSKPMPIVPIDFVTKCIIDHLHSAHNTIYLAALNTETKYNKVSNWYELIFIVSSYFHSQELITGLEVVLIRLSLILASFSVYAFRFIGYIMNELFAPKTYKYLLPLIYQYRHFSRTSFHVQGGITPSADFDGKQYLTIIGETAAVLCKKPICDLTCTLPFKYDKNLMISIMNTCFSFILYRTTHKVIVDTDKLKALSSKKNILLLPTHRSFYDFLLICKICLKYKMFGLSMPLSFATSKFKQSPFIAMCMALMNTIFIDTGSNHIKNGFLRKKIKENKDKNNVFQLFIEGTRSRNRQFLKPHHGVLSILAEVMDLCIVPITINYERVPEQNSFYRELDGEKCSFSAIDLCGWLYDVIAKNDVSLGDINIEIGDVIEIKQRAYDKQYFATLVNQIQLRQMQMVNITRYHIEHFKPKHEVRMVEHLLNHKGCNVLSTTLNRQINDKDVYMNTLQFAHFVADYMDFNTKAWLTNGNFVSNNNQNKRNTKITMQQKEFIENISSIIERYRSFNYMNQSMMNLNLNKHKSSSSPSGAVRIRVGDESLGYWGYTDSYFLLKDDKLFFKGSRYEISGKYFDATISFLSKLSNIPLLRKRNCFPVNVECKETQNEDEKQESPEEEDELMRFLHQLFGIKHVTTDIHIRFHHGTGHTVSDMLHLRVENTGFRIPDIVVYAQNKCQIIELVARCVELNACLIPYGGGTNVTHALWCDAKEKRRIISLDVSGINKVIWINRANRTANIMAGITGKKLESELNLCGFTMGHYPDSYEFSTLGGWIATFASGMKRSKYGNIEEIVIDFEVITATGLIHRNMGVYGRIAAGSNALSALFGSEGTLGVIVSAVVRLHRLPDTVSFDSIVFPKWCNGLNLMKMVRNTPANCRPASLRLVDNTQFKLSQTFKKKDQFSFLSKLYVTKWRRFNVEEMCAATIVYEGSANEIAIQKKMIHQLIEENNGIRGGEASGKAGFNLTFAIAYIRDFLLENFGILAESFETFIPWDKVDDFKLGLHASIVKKHKSMGLKGDPFLSSRISQIYNEGVCLYLYYGFYVESLNKYSFSIFDEMEHFIRKEMLRLGASISHHHGIGKLRADILKNDICSQQMIDLTKNVKKAFDPHNIFCANNGIIAN